MTHRTRLLLLIALCWTLGAQGGIYRWTDADGRVHFADHPPPDGSGQASRLPAGYEREVPFTFEIIPVDYRMPAETHTKVEIAVAKIHEIYRSRLGQRFPTDPSFDIRIFKDQRDFASYRDGSPLAGIAAGYFSPEHNEAVTWRQRNFEQMLEVITHEANHALMHHRYKDVPPWLNEGLSEYFERMVVFGQALVIPPNAHWDALVREGMRDGSTLPLRRYLDLPRPEWLLHNLPDNRAYAQAWSLVCFMMSTREGTRLLGRLLDTLDRVGAGAFSGPDTIEAEYPGGLTAFDTAWRAWAFGPKQPHHY